MSRDIFKIKERVNLEGYIEEGHFKLGNTAKIFRIRADRLIIPSPDFEREHEEYTAEDIAALSRLDDLIKRGLFAHYKGGKTVSALDPYGYRQEAHVPLLKVGRGTIRLKEDPPSGQCRTHKVKLERRVDDNTYLVEETYEPKARKFGASVRVDRVIPPGYKNVRGVTGWTRGHTIYRLETWVIPEGFYLFSRRFRLPSEALVEYTHNDVNRRFLRKEFRQILTLARNYIRKGKEIQI